VSENLNNDELVALAREVLDIESRAVNALRARLDDDFATACRLINDTPGRVVVTGMGKSGHISSKIAATLASTGTPAFFMHPAEASHGDLGMITENDLVLAISYSGETAEVVTILPLVKRMGAKLISMTGNPKSTLARIANVHLNVAVSEEACPLNLAPTASTTATLAMGDALAVALLKNRGFTAEDFARSHPSGSLGKRLLLRVGDVMRTGEDIPAVGPEVLWTMAAGFSAYLPTATCAVRSTTAPMCTRRQWQRSCTATAKQRPRASSRQRPCTYSRRTR
jgi:arabinose-5-phosphate isomerase